MLTQAGTLIGQAQNELTTLQGKLGAVQSQLQQVVDRAADRVQQRQRSRLPPWSKPIRTAVATQLSALQTQLEASYQVTAQISQLRLVALPAHPHGLIASGRS